MWEHVPQICGSHFHYGKVEPAAAGRVAKHEQNLCAPVVQGEGTGSGGWEASVGVLSTARPEMLCLRDNL